MPCKVPNHPVGVEECWGWLHGRCVNDACDCNPWFYGEFCEWKKCPDRCNHKGDCIHLSHDDSECLCYPCFDGANCSYALPRMNTWKEIKPKAENDAGRPITPRNRTRCAATEVCGDLLMVGGLASDALPKTIPWPFGSQSGTMGDAWLFSFSTNWWWKPLRLKPLLGLNMPPRQSHSVVWAHGRTAWVFGGLDHRQKMRNDLWEIDVDKETVQPLHTSCPLCARPQARALHAATTDHQGTMWIFGGQTYVKTKILYLGDLWRIRCRVVNGTCEDSWGTETKGNSVNYSHSTRHAYGTPGNLGGGMLWLSLHNFIDSADAAATDAEVEALRGQKPYARADAALTYHLSSSGVRRLILFGGFDGGEYLNDLWTWELTDNDSDEYYSGKPTFSYDNQKMIDSRLTKYYPFADAIGRWRRLSPPGLRPSARDTHLGLSSGGLPAGGMMYTILGRASNNHAQADYATVWGYDPVHGGNGTWYSIPRRNDGPAAREESCGGIGVGPLGKQLFSFGGYVDYGYPTPISPLFGREPGGVTDEFWMFDNTCVPPVVSKIYPLPGRGACPADSPQLPPCGYGHNAVGSPTPCVGHFEYEAPFVHNPTTYLNDFTSFDPPMNLRNRFNRSHLIKRSVDEWRGRIVKPLRGPNPDTITGSMPDGNPVRSAGLNPEKTKWPLRDLDIGPQAHQEYLTRPREYVEVRIVEPRPPPPPLPPTMTLHEALVARHRAFESVEEDSGALLPPDSRVQVVPVE